MDQNVDYRSLLQNISRNPDQIHVFDCSFEANPYWYNQEYSRSDPRPEQEKMAYWQEVEKLKDKIDQKNISIRTLLGRYDLQLFGLDNVAGCPNTHLPTQYYSGLLLNSFKEVECWPTRFFHTTILETKDYLYNDGLSRLLQSLPEKLFVSHMHFPKPHRLALLEILIDNNVINKGTVRFCNNLSRWREFLNKQHDFGYSDLVVKILPHAPDIFSPYRYSPDSSHDLTFTMDPHYSTGFIDISPESHYGVNFITQKSCQPILWGKPFCMMGSTQQNTILKKLGFELFDEIFDLSHEPDELQLVPTNNKLYLGKDYYFIKDHYHKLLKNLWNVDDSKESILDMKQKFSAKIEHNLNRYMQILFDDDMLPEYQEIRESFLVVGSRNIVKSTSHLQRYLPLDKRKDRK